MLYEARLKAPRREKDYQDAVMKESSAAVPCNHVSLLKQKVIENSNKSEANRSMTLLELRKLISFTGKVKEMG